MTGSLMIHNEAQCQQTLEQLQHMYRALAELRRDMLPKNPRTFAVLAEGPLDYIRQFVEELEQYRQWLLAEPQIPDAPRQAGWSEPPPIARGGTMERLDGSEVG